MSDEQKTKTTDDPLPSLEGRAKGTQDTGRIAHIDEEDPEGDDIEAFLAELERGPTEGTVSTDASMAGMSGSESKPDPFADAFAMLDEEHGSEVEAEFAKRSLHTPPAPPFIQTTSMDDVFDGSSGQNLETAVDLAPTVDKERHVDKEQHVAHKEDMKEDAKVEDGPVPGVEKARASGFKFVSLLLKWSFFVFPAWVLFWVGGSILAGWISTGWVVLLVSSIIVFLVPGFLRLISGKGRYGWWLFGCGVFFSVCLIAPMPAFTGQRVGHYGHWPISAMGQIMDWKVDNPAMRIASKLGSFVGAQFRYLKSFDGELEPLNMGSAVPVGALPKAPGVIAPKAKTLGTKNVEHKQPELKDPAPKDSSVKSPKLYKP